MKEKGLIVERSDYFSALKVFCLKFSYEFGLQAVKIFGRKKTQISVFLVPPGSFFNYDRKRNQIDAKTYFNYKYQVKFLSLPDLATQEETNLIFNTWYFMDNCYK